MSAGFAGNWVQLIMVLGLCVGWVSTYLFRVATKQMTYVKQLEQYETAGASPAPLGVGETGLCDAYGVGLGRNGSGNGHASCCGC